MEPVYQDYMHQLSLKKKLKDIKHEMKQLESIVYKKQLKGFHKLLKNLGLIEKGRLTKKGLAVACINSPFSLILTELMVDHYF